MALIQYFSIQLSKYLFASERHGFLAADAPLKRADAVRFGLRPLWIYVVGVEGLPARHIEVAFPERAINPLRFLMSAWRDRLAVNGMPDLLRIDREVTQRAPFLQQALEGLDVASIAADPGDLGLHARLRVAQGEAGMALLYPWKGLSPASGIGDVNAALAREGDQLMRYIFAEASAAALGVIGRDYMLAPSDDAEVEPLLATADKDWRKVRAEADVEAWFGPDQAAIRPRGTLVLLSEAGGMGWLSDPGDAVVPIREHWHACELPEARGRQAMTG